MKFIIFALKVHKELLEIARNSMINNKCDLVVANDKSEMVSQGSHIAYIQDIYGNVIKCDGKEKIADELLYAINNNDGISKLKW